MNFKGKIAGRRALLFCVGLAAVAGGALFLKAQNAKPNIVFITVDSLRADHLGCYGYKRDTSPHIDALSKKGTLFAQAIAQASWTTASVSSIITSLYPGHEREQLGRGVNAQDENLVRILKKNGYTTALFSNALTILDVTLANVKKDFDVFNIQKGKADTIVDSINRWLSGSFRKPVFLWAYLFDVHWPYRAASVYSAEFLSDGLYPHQDVPITEVDGRKNEFFSFKRIPRCVAEGGITDTSYYVAKYDGGIKFADEQISRLLSILRDRGMDKNTLIVLFADHGESMTEHDFYFNHSHYLYEGLIRVPLIMVLPGKIPSQVIQPQIPMLSVMPTVLEILGIKNTKHMEGKSLLPLIEGDKKGGEEHVFSESSFGPFFPRSVRSDGWKLIYNRRHAKRPGYIDYELYDLKADPGETKNLAEEQPRIAELLKNKLGQWEKSAKTFTLVRSKRFDERNKEALRSLGYL
jgi:arylsulfatase A-like enzyme